jgi:hypothetical protein
MDILMALVMCGIGLGLIMRLSVIVDVLGR